ncbi:hypothetical protein [Streptomyces hiroshimensis]|uniref:Uncharacterized protein n=1 Tax=Streptomyces hiroshimensis TaxID=66424 RepID=A0ABQ2YN94_9ACTN|nr:hypothetical protein [Streptomyces hiroshimensis]GGX88388.1 hypothetical protein GCM10010324_37710 [Streptomyces hiroshimensis]
MTPARPVPLARRLLTITVSALLALGTTAAAGRTQEATAQAPGTRLTCSVRTVPGRPLTFSPPLGAMARPVTATGAVLLDGCSSPDGSAPRIASGRLDFRGSGRASCTRVTGARGTGRLVWYGAAGRQGRALGTSALTLTPHPGASSVAAGFLSGTVASGMLAHRQVTGHVSAAGTSRCLTRGLPAVEAAGRVSFS